VTVSSFSKLNRVSPNGAVGDVEIAAIALSLQGKKGVVGRRGLGTPRQGGSKRQGGELGRVYGTMVQAQEMRTLRVKVKIGDNERGQLKRAALPNFLLASVLLTGSCADNLRVFAATNDQHSVYRGEVANVTPALSTEEKRSLDRAKKYYRALAALANQHSNCVLGTARAMATITDEPAETVAKAAVAACYEDRDKFNALHKAYGLREATIDEWEADENADLKFVILEVIKQRTIKQSQPIKPHETPI
jgi:hypothetical protein